MENKTLYCFFIYNILILLRGDLNTGTNYLFVLSVLVIIFKILNKIKIKI